MWTTLLPRQRNWNTQRWDAARRWWIIDFARVRRAYSTSLIDINITDSLWKINFVEVDYDLRADANWSLALLFNFQKYVISSSTFDKTRRSLFLITLFTLHINPFRCLTQILISRECFRTVNFKTELFLIILSMLIHTSMLSDVIRRIRGKSMHENQFVLKQPGFCPRCFSRHRASPKHSTIWELSCFPSKFNRKVLHLTFGTSEG